MERTPTSWADRQMTRRALLSDALLGAATLTPLGWLLVPQAVTGDAGPRLRPTPAAGYDAAVANAWFDLMLRLIRHTPGFSPPVASRAIGCAGLALYEALLPGLPDHVSLAAMVNDTPMVPSDGRNAAYHWPSVANAAMAAITRSLFPTAPASLQAEINALEGHRLEAGLSHGIRARSIDRGRAVAAAVDDWARADGGHEGHLHSYPADYSPPVGPGLWVPTAPAYLPALQPYWGANRCMVLGSADDCAPGPHPAFSTAPDSAFYTEAVEVYDTVNQLTADQEAIARFWADDPGATATPPGHSLSIMTQLLRAQDRSLTDAAEAYARLGAVLCDSFIACWHAKYSYNLVRPITYIRAHIDPSWGNQLPVTTPPFPEYPSGHSVQTATAAEVLAATFGTFGFTDHTHDARGLPSRSFESFEGFAQEAAISRLYGGIHFRAAIERGIDQGRCIGSKVVQLPLKQ